MKFDTLEDAGTKITYLMKVGNTFYYPKEDLIRSTPLEGELHFILDNKEKARLTSFYRKAYYANTNMSCKSCREHRLIQVDIELNLFLDSLKEKYGK